MANRRNGWLRHEVGGLPMWGLVAIVAFMLGAGLIAFVSYSTSGNSAASWTRYTAPPEAPDKPVALFIGDSYTAGTGATSTSTRWSTLVSSGEQWAEANYGRGGTGFVTTSGVEGCGRELCPVYADTIGEAVDDGIDPAFVVIAGGQNDSIAWAEDSSAVVSGIDATYQAARAAFPDAKIISVGPSWIGAVQPWQIDFDAAVQAAASSVGATYISLIDPWLLNDPAMELGDGGHVNDLGHQAIADRVLAGI